MKAANHYQKYTGETLAHYHKGLRLDAYIPSEELIQAVEIARLLNRPLLLRGEPGCGKTRLAEAVAVELHGEKYQNFYFPWPIKSVTKAQDGLYRFDHLERMQQVYAAKEMAQDIAKVTDDLMQYVKFGPIGQAYLQSNKSPASPPPVILIDEIDKADIDFPNDLLWELDKGEFFISEVKDKSGNDTRVGIDHKDKSPIVIITSNDEKELPNAFLRRCLFHYIEFPKGQQLELIVTEYLKGQAEHQGENAKPHLPVALKRFEELRDILGKNPNTIKKPSTSELLDWARILAVYLGQEGWALDDKMNLLHNDKIRIRPEQILLKNRDDERLVGKS